MRLELTEEAQLERDDFESIFDGAGCTCFQSARCYYCTHPGNPNNQAEDESAWIKVFGDEQ